MTPHMQRTGRPVPSRKILIVGGGIGGLALAALLRKDGMEVMVTEKAREWRTVGYVLGLFPNGQHILERIGIKDALVAQSAVIPAHLAKDAKGRLLVRTDFSSSHRYGPVLEAERDALHVLLRQAAAGAQVRLGTTIRDMTENPEGVAVTFTDGSHDLFDAVIGADGIDSAVRRHVAPASKKYYTGIAFWLMWVERSAHFPPEVEYYFGDRKGAAFFPSAGGRVAAAFILPLPRHFPVEPGQYHDFLRERFGDMGGAVPELLAGMPQDPRLIFHHDDDEMHLRRWSKGRVALLGDSPHALTPILGMGASMALEDAAVLAEELSRPDGDVAEALLAYERRRLPRVRLFWRWSRIAHRVISTGGPFSAVRDRSVRYLIPAYFRRLDRLLAQEI